MVGDQDRAETSPYQQGHRSALFHAGQSFIHGRQRGKRPAGGRSSCFRGVGDRRSWVSFSISLFHFVKYPGYVPSFSISCDDEAGCAYGSGRPMAMPCMDYLLDVSIGHGYMKIHLLDPGLCSFKGHHFDLDVRLARSLALRGHEVLLCGAMAAKPELRAHLARDEIPFLSTFRRSPYFSAKPRWPLRVRLGKWVAGRHVKPTDEVTLPLYQEAASDTAEDLACLPPADAWFWTTLSAYQLSAACSANQVPQIAGAWWLPPFQHEAAVDVWTESARRIRREHLPIKVGFYDEELCRRADSFSDGLAMECLPCPHDGADGMRDREGLRRIGFFGHQRPARGRDLLRELVPILSSKGFEVVVQDSGGGVRYGGQAVVLPFVEDFAAELARCDAVIWPSRPETYAWNLSGVVSECIASGVPVIMPARCLPAEIAARYDCVHCFHEHSCAGVMEALERMAGDFPATLARCEAARRSWRAANGTDRLARRIEELAEG